MKKSGLNRIRQICECFAEKCMEWIHSLCYSFTMNEEWHSNLSEHYCIYKDYINKEYVKEFLRERERIINRNRYKMHIEVIDETGAPNIVGKVVLRRKKRVIHQATLKVSNYKEKEGMIFWSFDKQETA